MYIILKFFIIFYVVHNMLYVRMNVVHYNYLFLYIYNINFFIMYLLYNSTRRCTNMYTHFNLLHLASFCPLVATAKLYSIITGLVLQNHVFISATKTYNSYDFENYLRCIENVLDASKMF